MEIPRRSNEISMFPAGTSKILFHSMQPIWEEDEDAEEDNDFDPADDSDVSSLDEGEGSST